MIISHHDKSRKRKKKNLTKKLSILNAYINFKLSKVSNSREFNSNKLNKFSENGNLPFGGGSGAGVNISPMAFLVVKDGNTKLLTMNGVSPVEKLVDIVPDVINKAQELIQKGLENPNKVLKQNMTAQAEEKKTRTAAEEKNPDDFEDEI